MINISELKELSPRIYLLTDNSIRLVVRELDRFNINADLLVVAEGGDDLDWAFRRIRFEANTYIVEVEVVIPGKLLILRTRMGGNVMIITEQKLTEFFEAGLSSGNVREIWITSCLA